MIAQRIAVSVPVVIGVAALVFFVMEIVPGDAVDVLAAQGDVTDAHRAEIRTQLGLDRSVWVRFGDFLADAARLDFGTSYRSRADGVTDLVRAQLPPTLQLTLASVLFGSLLGIGLGIVAALWRGTWIDRGAMFVSVAGISVPPFWLAIVLLLVFGVWLGWLPVVAGRTPGSLWEIVDPRTFRGLALPVLTLGLALAAGVARLVRSQMLEVLSQDYVRTARAKGLLPRTVILHHALRNALIPAVTLIGIQLGNLLGGAVVIEIVFARPGLGRLLVDAINENDLPVVQGIVLVIAVGYVAMTLLVDIAYRLLDPRLRTAT